MTKQFAYNADRNRALKLVHTGRSVMFFERLYPSMQAFGTPAPILEVGVSCVRVRDRWYDLAAYTFRVC
jgi:hypothetical protein